MTATSTRQENVLFVVTESVVCIANTQALRSSQYDALISA